MRRVVAILDTMWDWRTATSEAGYKEAPRYFHINPENHSGRRLYKLIGKDSLLLVTNVCRELVNSAGVHGKPDPLWLSENLSIIDRHPLGQIQLLLVCGTVAQKTYRLAEYRPPTAHVMEIAHPAARSWSRKLEQDIIDIIARRAS